MNCEIIEIIGNYLPNYRTGTVQYRARNLILRAYAHTFINLVGL